jgi:hypothetical protein
VEKSRGLLIMETINIMENGLLLDYSEWENLNTENQNKYFTSDDFSDCDYLKFKNNTIVEFFKIENTIYYIIVNSEFEIYEDSIKQILLNFFEDDFKKHFFELDTAYLTDSEKVEYEKILNSNITLFYRGGAGYYYGVHKLINKKLIAEIDYTGGF